MNKNLHKHIRNRYEKVSTGMPLTEKDLKLLEEVKMVYEKQGLVPTKNELPKDVVCRLKSRFRTWGNVLCAAGLPALNDPEEKRKRMAQIENNIKI